MLVIHGLGHRLRSTLSAPGYRPTSLVHVRSNWWYIIMKLSPLSSFHGLRPIHNCWHSMKIYGFQVVTSTKRRDSSIHTRTNIHAAHSIHSMKTLIAAVAAAAALKTKEKNQKQKTIEEKINCWSSPCHQRRTKKKIIEKKPVSHSFYEPRKMSRAVINSAIFKWKTKKKMLKRNRTEEQRLEQKFENHCFEVEDEWMRESFRERRAYEIHQQMMYGDWVVGDDDDIKFITSISTCN